MEATPESKPPPYRSAEMGFGLEEIHDLMYSPPGTGCSRSFTALLELPPPQAVELLVKEDFPAKHPPPLPSPIFPSDTGLIDRALLELKPPQAVELSVKEDFPAKHPPPLPSPNFPSDTGLTDRALLELPPPQAVELLLKEDFPSKHPPPAIFPSNTCLIDRALLEFSPPQAVELLVEEDFPAKHPLPLPSPIFPADTALIDRSRKLSIFASPHNSPVSNTILAVSSPIKLDVVKQEPLDSSPTVSNQRLKPCKRKEREKKVEESNKKSKKMEANEASQDGSELPYVHVRARRGQATDSHSLAERARREKINARMKLLQELVPGCNKISGTTVVLDEIISHVQALQRQVEFLSMRLAAVNPRTDFNFDALAQSAFSMDNGYMGMFNPSIATEGQIINGNKQLQHQQLWHCNELHQPVWTREEVDNSNFITPDNPFLNYDSSANSAFLHPSHPKLEL